MSFFFVGVVSDAQFFWNSRTSVLHCNLRDWFYCLGVGWVKLYFCSENEYSPDVSKIILF